MGPGAGWQPTAGGSGAHDGRRERSGMALAALICGLAGLLLCFLVVPSIVAVVLGLVAAGRIKRSGGALSGLGAARAGWITGIVGLGFATAFFTAAALGAFDDDGAVGVFDLDPGDCVDIDLSEDFVEVDTLPRVDCDEPHNGEVVLTGELNADDAVYPSDDELFQRIGERCEAATGLPPNVLLPIAPDERAWNIADGPFVCIRIR
jgi:hypothetical protein